ncbi:MAG: hypothetical protein ACE5H7_13975 [Acidiferrobacterales bacterium]
MTDPITQPPVIRGLTRTASSSDKFDSMMSALSSVSDNGIARDRINEAITLLLQAGKDDPMLRPILGRAILALTEGPTQPPNTRRDAEGLASPARGMFGT